MQINVSVQDANNILCEVTPPQPQIIVIDRGVEGNGIVSIVPVTISTFQYLRITYTNGTVQDVGPLTSTAYTATAPITIVGNTISLATVPIASGGTDATTAAGAIQNLLPSYTGNANKRLGLNSAGTALEWVADGGGTVTSVAATVPAFLSITGSPITSSGTLAFGLSGTPLPTSSGGTGITTFTANGVVYASSTSALTTGSSLVFDGTNLGIGTNSPTGKLTIDISATSGYWERFYSSGTELGYWYFDASTLQLSSKSATRALTFLTNDTERMRLDTSGNLGLGVTPSAWSSSYKALEMGTGTALMSYTSSTPGFELGSNNYFNGTNYIYRINGKAAQYVVNNGVHYWAIAETGTAGNAITFTQAMTLTSGGELGVGTTSPTQKFHVSNAGGVIGLIQNTASSTDVRMRVQNTLSYFEMGHDATGGYLQELGAYPICFYTNGAERARITSSGNFGIGTSNPSNKLDVAGNIASSGNGCLLALNSTSDGIYIVGGNKSYNAFSVGDYGMGSVGALKFATNNAINMTLDTASNLGLGITPSGWTTGKAIEVGGAGNALWYVGVNDVRLMANAYYNGNYIYGASQPASYLRQASGAFQFYTAPSGTAGTAATFTQAMTLGANGRLLIGGTTDYSNGLVQIRQSADGYGYAAVDSGATFSAYLRADAVGARVGNNSTVPLIFDTNSVERARIDTSGNLGLGVTPRAWGSGYKVLDIASFASLASENNTNAETLLLNNAYNSGTAASPSWIRPTYNYSTYLSQASGSFRFYLGGVGTAGTAITWTQAMTLDSSSNLNLPIGNLYLGDASHSTQISSGSSGIPLIFGINGTEKSRLNTNGDFLVGTTTATFGQSGRGLIEVNGSSQSLISLKAAGAPKAYWHYNGTDVDFLANNGCALNFYANGSLSGKFATSGNFGIGTSTPSYRLDVSSANVGVIGRFSSSGNYSGVIADTGTTTGGGYFGAYQNGTRYAIFSTSGAWLGDSSTDASIAAEASGGSIRFYTNGSASERARINSNGTLLLGITSLPSGLSTTTGFASSKGASFGGGTAGVQIGSSGDNSSYDGIKMYSLGYNGGSPAFVFTPTTTPGSGVLGTRFQFNNSNGSSTSANNLAIVQIEGGLQVGYSTATLSGQSYRLYVINDNSGAGIYSSGQNHFITSGNEFNFTNSYTSANDVYLNYKSGGGLNAYVNAYRFMNGAGAYQATYASAFNVTSDYRVKTDVQEVGSVLSKVMALRPVNYIKDGRDEREFGLLAHEADEQFHDIVRGKGKDAVDEDGDMHLQSVDYMGLTAILTKAIQEQQSIIESLKARLDAANL